MSDDENKRDYGEERLRLFAEEQGITLEEAKALADQGARQLAEAIYRLSHPETGENSP